MTKDPSDRSEKSGNKLMAFSGMALQMGVTIAGFAIGGNELDKYQQNEKPIWTIILSLSGIAIALYIVFRQIKRITDD